jgi:hypothetical protein
LNIIYSVLVHRNSIRLFDAVLVDANVQGLVLLVVAWTSSKDWVLAILEKKMKKIWLVGERR